MFNNFFSKKENHLDGNPFKQKFEASANAILIDVRTPGEYASGTISGAINIDLLGSDFQKQVQKLDNSKKYFLFCRSGNRSSSAESVFEKFGLQSYNLTGGIGAWPK
jgi:rhodanese-related sulfurtransferase